MEGFIKPRTVMLCDSAEFSDHLGYIDEVILETSVETFSLSNYSNARQTCMRISNPNFNFSKSNFANGEMMTIKTFNKNRNISNDKCLVLLSHEYKIVKLIGAHENIVELIGVAVICFQDYGLVSHFISDKSLSIFLQEVDTLDNTFVRDFTYGLAQGVCKIHEQGILHNNLTVSNVLLRSCNNQPVIHDFSWSCRAESAHLLTIHQMEYFKDALHLPIGVRKGKEIPSKTSDHFGFGHILQRICMHANGYKNQFSDTLTLIAKPCLEKKLIFNLWVLVDDKLSNRLKD